MVYWSFRQLNHWPIGPGLRDHDRDWSSPCFISSVFLCLIMVQWHWSIAWQAHYWSVRPLSYIGLFKALCMCSPTNVCEGGYFWQLEYWTTGKVDRRTNGPVEHWTIGPVDHYTVCQEPSVGFILGQFVVYKSYVKRILRIYRSKLFWN